MMGRDRWEMVHLYQDVGGGRTGGGYDLIVVVFNLCFCLLFSQILCLFF